VDHQAKSKDDRGLWAIGSQRKLAAIDGAAYIAEVKVAPTKTKDGHLRIVCAKDRHGTHQRGHTVADVHICTTDDGIGVAVVAPAETFRPTGLMEKVSRFLEETPTASTRHILAGVAGKDRHIRTALDVLLAEGFVRSERGGHGGQQWSSREPFRDPANPENATAAPRPHRGPESGPRLELDSEALRPHINRARPPRPTAAPPAGRGDRGPTAAPPEQNATKDHETSHRSTAAPRPHRGPASGPRAAGRPRPRRPDPRRSTGPAGQQSSPARDRTGDASPTTAAPTSDVPSYADPGPAARPPYGVGVRRGSSRALRGTRLGTIPKRPPPRHLTCPSRLTPSTRSTTDRATRSRHSTDRSSCDPPARPTPRPPRRRSQPHRRHHRRTPHRLAQPPRRTTRLPHRQRRTRRRRRHRPHRQPRRRQPRRRNRLRQIRPRHPRHAPRPTLDGSRRRRPHHPTLAPTHRPVAQSARHRSRRTPHQRVEPLLRTHPGRLHRTRTPSRR